MPRQGVSDYGTLYATISVLLPADLTEEEQAVLTAYFYMRSVAAAGQILAREA